MDIKLNDLNCGFPSSKWIFLYKEMQFWFINSFYFQVDKKSMIWENTIPGSFKDFLSNNSIIAMAKYFLSENHLRIKLGEQFIAKYTWILRKQPCVSPLVTLTRGCVGHVGSGEGMVTVSW